MSANANVMAIPVPVFVDSLALPYASSLQVADDNSFASILSAGHSHGYGRADRRDRRARRWLCKKQIATLEQGQSLHHADETQCCATPSQSVGPHRLHSSCPGPQRPNLGISFAVFNVAHTKRYQLHAFHLTSCPIQGAPKKPPTLFGVATA